MDQLEHKDHHHKVTKEAVVDKVMLIQDLKDHKEMQTKVVSVQEDKKVQQVM